MSVFLGRLSNAEISPGLRLLAKCPWPLGVAQRANRFYCRRWMGGKPRAPRGNLRFQAIVRPTTGVPPTQPDPDSQCALNRRPRRPDELAWVGRRHMLSSIRISFFFLLSRCAASIAKSQDYKTTPNRCDPIPCSCALAPSTLSTPTYTGRSATCAPSHYNKRTASDFQVFALAPLFRKTCFPRARSLRPKRLIACDTTTSRPLPSPHWKPLSQGPPTRALASNQARPR